MIVDAPFAYLGSKRVLVPFIIQHLPKAWNKQKGTFIEPFMGSGAVMLNIQWQSAILSDIECPIVNMYMFLQECTETQLKMFRRYLFDLIKNDSEQIFTKCVTKQSKQNATCSRMTISDVANYIYIRRRSTMGRCYYNETCEKYITLYRKDNESVRFEPLWSKICDIRKTLQGRRTVWKIQDFEKTLKDAKRGDFCFLDPPYFDLETSTKYYSMLFTLDQQYKLVQCILDLHERGCFIMLFNIRSALLDKILRDFKCTKVTNNNRKNTRFTNYKEVVYTNYEN